MHFCLKCASLVAFQTDLNFFDFRDFCMVGRWLTLAALSQEVCRRMENLRLRLQSLYIEVQYASWHKDVRLSLESYVELKVEIHKKALEGPNVHLLHGRRVLRTIFKKIVCKNVFPEVINAFLLEICKSGGISDGIEIFGFS